MHLPAVPENSFVLNFEDAASSWMEVCFFSAVDLYHVSFYFGTEVGQLCKVLLNFFAKGLASPAHDGCEFIRVGKLMVHWGRRPVSLHRCSEDGATCAHTCVLVC